MDANNDKIWIYVVILGSRFLNNCQTGCENVEFWKRDFCAFCVSFVQIIKDFCSLTWTIGSRRSAIADCYCLLHNPTFLVSQSFSHHKWSIVSAFLMSLSSCTIVYTLVVLVTVAVDWLQFCLDENVFLIVTYWTRRWQSYGFYSVALMRLALITKSYWGLCEIARSILSQI